MNKLTGRLIGLLCSAALLLGMLPGAMAAAPEITQGDQERGRIVEEPAEGAGSSFADEAAYGAESSFAEENADIRLNDRVEIPVVRNLTQPDGQASTFSLVQSGNDYIFTTFADLQQLAAGSYATITRAFYHGSGPLVIEEDLSMPDNLQLGYVQEMRIPAGVTFTDGSFLSVADLTVDGTAHLNELFIDNMTVNGGLTLRLLDVRESLTVNGVLRCLDTIWLREGSVVTGRENIVLVYDGCEIWKRVEIDDAAELMQVLAQAAAGGDEPYFLDVREDITLTGSVTIPESCVMIVREGMTIPAGCTLTVNGRAEFQAPVYVEGILANNRHLTVVYGNGGLLTFAAGGRYTGEGELEVYCLGGNTFSDFSQVFPGLDMSDFAILYEGFNGENYYCALSKRDTFATFADLQQLAAGSYTSRTEVYYNGSGPLVIEEDLVLPDNLWLHVNQLQIPAGVTFTGGAWMEVGELTVNGNAYLNELTADNMTVNGEVFLHYLEVQESLTVNSVLRCQDTIMLFEGCVVTGRENIVLVYDWCEIWQFVEIRDTAALMQALARAAADGDESYFLSVREDITLTGSVTIPENCRLMVRRGMTISAGCTLTVNGRANFRSSVYVEGILTNNGRLSVEYSSGGLLTFAPGSGYLGEGELEVYCYGSNMISNPAQALPGLDMDRLAVLDQGSDGDSRYWVLVKRETFKSFAALQQLAAGSYPSRTEIYYNGSGPLVIEEDLVLPDNLWLHANQLQIPAGVTFTGGDWMEVGELTVNGRAYLGEVYADHLTVNGEAVLRYLDVFESLTVNGVLRCEETIWLRDGVVVTGRENIVLENEWSQIFRRLNIYTLPELMQAIARAAADEDEAYFLNAYENITLTGSVTIPANCRMVVRGGMTVPAGCTLTLNGRTEYRSPVYVQGILANNGYLSVEYSNGGLLTFAPGSGYTGNGELEVYCRGGNAISDPAQALPGLDLDNFDVERGTYYWLLRNMAGLTRLAAPTNLEWGHHYDLDGRAMPGIMSWQPHEPTQSRALVNIYRVGEQMPATRANWRFGSGGDLPEWRSCVSFVLGDFESGTYYFTVTSQGDGVQYRNSETVTSDPWTYVKPDKKLDPCSNLSWSWPSVRYTGPSDMTNVAGYMVQFYYAAFPDAEPVDIGGTWTYLVEPDEVFFPELWDEELQEYGPGYYYFQVRALSSDITAVANSDWSDLSPAFYLSGLIEEIEAELGEVIADKSSLTEDEIRDAVQSIDPEELKSAMLADMDGTGVLADIAELEDAVGGAADVAVSPEASAFDADKISIVGANLNDAAASGDPITLIIDKPEEEHVLDAAYDNAVAVKFSMDLDNVADSENLAVPVVITLPIPEDINPDFLVILHYHADGSGVEEVMIPYIYWDNGQWYASFALTSFSDFIMTQYAAGHSHIWSSAWSKDDDYHWHECTAGGCDVTENSGKDGYGAHSYYSVNDASCEVCGHIRELPDNSDHVVAMYRMYNPNTGEHFYTGSTEERDDLLAAGWNYEGIGFHFYDNDPDPVYRLFDPNTGEHLYTMDTAEIAYLQGQGWNLEGVAFNSAAPDKAPQYRLHNPNESVGAYHFTNSLKERDDLLAEGWEDQGIGFYSLHY